MPTNDPLPRSDVSTETLPSPIDVELSKVSSPALARIIEEVRNEDASTSRAYDRVHNRHNR